MMKKLSVMLFTASLFFMTLFVNASAARQIEYPTVLGIAYGDESIVLNKFEIISVENLAGKYQNRIHLDVQIPKHYYVDNFYLSCYDAQGNYITQLYFNPTSEYIDVPDITASLELWPYDTTYFRAVNTYFYNKYENVYAADGRAMGVSTLQVPVYEMVGWYKPVTVYAEDGRTLEISPFQIAAYEQVGWYSSKEKMLFQQAEKDFNQVKASGDYSKIMDTVDLQIKNFKGTEYESFWYTKRTEVMDLWRKAINSPIAIRTYTTGKNSIGVPRATIHFTNVSYKKVLGFKLKFDCYNLFGEREKTYYTWYYIDDANMETAETDYFWWDLHGADSVSRLSNIRITEVVFADGTKWVA